MWLICFQLPCVMLIIIFFSGYCTKYLNIMLWSCHVNEELMTNKAGMSHGSVISRIKRQFTCPLLIVWQQNNEQKLVTLPWWETFARKHEVDLPSVLWWIVFRLVFFLDIKTLTSVDVSFIAYYTAQISFCFGFALDCFRWIWIMIGKPTSFCF